MTDLEAKLAALTCLWCKRGIPKLANGRHEFHDGSEADCDSKAKEILWLCHLATLEAVANVKDQGWYPSNDRTLPESGVVDALEGVFAQ